MDILIRLLMALEAVVCLMLIGVILIQRSKGRGMGISFGGGAAEAVFGAQMGNVLTRTTVILAAIFLINTTILAILKPRGASADVTERLPAPDPVPVEAPAATPAPATTPVDLSADALADVLGPAVEAPAAEAPAAEAPAAEAPAAEAPAAEAPAAEAPAAEAPAAEAPAAEAPAAEAPAAEAGSSR